MGCSSCTSTNEIVKKEPEKETLTDQERFCTYRLPVQEEDYMMTFDFQTREAKVFNIVLDPAVTDYSVFISHPFLFVAGGADKHTKELSRKFWVTSAGDGTVHMASSKVLAEPRRKPFLVSPKNGVIYIIGGYKATDGERVLACEKTQISEDSINLLRPMNMGHDCVVSMGSCVYALGEPGNEAKFECLDSLREDEGWSIRTIHFSGEVSCHSRFGVAPEDEACSKILIFGGLTKEGRHTADAYSLDGKTGEMRRARTNLPDAEDFMVPADVGRRNNYLITRTWQLYVFQRQTGTWWHYPTNIVAQICQRGLHVR